MDSPLSEVFGFPINDDSERARYYRKHALCPFNNRVPNCTKDRVNDPLGVCSISAPDNHNAITCPVRFRQDWQITAQAAAFFFPDQSWTAMAEVRLNDADGVSAGNIDFVLVAYDEIGRITDFGTLEVQAVYISGNIRKPFTLFMKDPASYLRGESRQRTRARPDYLSSSRKRLLPQMLYKGTILHAWGKKQAVALQRGFFDTLPELSPVDVREADIAWFVYDIDEAAAQRPRPLTLQQVVYTAFNPALERIISPSVGSVEAFQDQLQAKLDERNDWDEEDQPSLNDLL